MPAAMRRKDRAISLEEAFAVIDGAPYATLSLADANGNPYAVPVSPVRDGLKIYFHCALAGAKTECMRANPNVCLVFVGSASPRPEDATMNYESAIAYGVASEIQDADERLFALRALCRRYGAQEACEDTIERHGKATAVWRVDVEGVTGKANRPKG